MRRSSTIGWVVAVLGHGVLLLAIILQQPVALQPVARAMAVSLIVEPPGRAVPVAPKPSAVPAERPRAVPALITDAAPPAPKPPAKAASVAPPKSVAAPVALPKLPAPPAATGGVAKSTSGPAAPGFVAAAPLAGNANQPPEYPDAAVAHGEQGEVLLSIHVLPDGRTDFVSVTQSSGYRVLDQAAQDAVLQWRFTPATMSGKAVVMVIPYWINFDLQTQSVRPAAQKPY